MKRTLIYIVTVCLFATSTVFGGIAQRYLVNVNGSAFKQVSGDGGSRIMRSAINNQRIFEEFGVSRDDYALVLDVGSESIVSLVPKSKSSGLDIIPVLQRADVRVAGNSQTGTSMFETPIGNGVAVGNIFAGLRGTMLGSLQFSEDDRLLRFSVNVQGSGTGGPILIKGGFSSGILLKFKVTRGAPFNQAP
jgi:hypothetical protein